jgi:hypothetical protein
VAENDPTLLKSILKARDWAREKVEPFLTWLPDSLEPYAVDFVAILVIAVAALSIWKAWAGLWRALTWLPASLYRLVTGHQPAKSETRIAAEATQRTEGKIDTLHDLIKRPSRWLKQSVTARLL